VVESDDVAFKGFFFYFIGTFLLGNNRSVLTCRLLVAMKVVSIIGAYDWGSHSYGFFIAYLTSWAYKYIPAMRPLYIGLSMMMYPRAYA